MVYSSQFSIHFSPNGQVPDAMAAMEIDGPTASTLPQTASPGLGGPRLSRQTTSGTSAISGRRSSSLRQHAASLVRQIPRLVVVLPGIAEVLDGVNEGVHAYYKGRISAREELANLEEVMKSLLGVLSSEPELLTADRGRAHLKQCIHHLQASVQNELQADPHHHRLGVAKRVNDIKTKLVDLIFAGILARYFVQPRQIVSNEFDSTVPTLRKVDQTNGLVIRELISTRRYDGSAVDDSFEDLHIYTYQATYQGLSVEVEDYSGGPNDYLIETVTELVDCYSQRGLNPVIQNLYGGSVLKDQKGRLHACLVLSPRQGTPWAELAKANQSIELMCQVAEKTSIMFKQLKQNKQMNFKDICVRPDGTLLLVPHTEGDSFLIDEDVFAPYIVDPGEEYEIGWPFGQVCLLLHESAKQALARDAVSSLRERDRTGGTWDEIAVWQIARSIGLRPPPSTMTFYGYPPLNWTMDPGLMICWPEGSEDMEHVARLPQNVMEEYEKEHLRSFMMINAMGKRGDELIVYTDHSRHENWFLPTQCADWECFPLEHWQGVDLISLSYESVRLDMVEWAVWKHPLRRAALKCNKCQEELGIVTRTDVSINIHKEDVPELGTRPIYFYRRKLSAGTSPQQFWGFFTFNRDPLGPTGLTIRHSGLRRLSRIVSESLPPDPPGYEPVKMIDIGIEYVNMCDDWDVKIKEQEEYILQCRTAMTPTCSTPDSSNWGIDVD